MPNFGMQQGRRNEEILKTYFLFSDAKFIVMQKFY